MKKGIDYEDFIIKFNIHRCAGFDEYTASHLLNENIIQKEVFILMIRMFHLN